MFWTCCRNTGQPAESAVNGMQRKHHKDLSVTFALFPSSEVDAVRHDSTQSFSLFTTDRVTIKERLRKRNRPLPLSVEETARFHQPPPTPPLQSCNPTLQRLRVCPRVQAKPEGCKYTVYFAFHSTKAPVCCSDSPSRCADPAEPRRLHRPHAKRHVIPQAVFPQFGVPT